VILLAGERDPVLPNPDDRGDDADLETGAFEHPTLFDMRFDVSDVPSDSGFDARAAGKTSVLQRLAHRALAAAVARCVDLFVGDSADIGPASEELAEMSFLIAPRRDFDGADGRIGIDHAGGFERIDDSERAVQPASEILALKMRPGEQFRSCLCAGTQHVADAVDLGSKGSFG
jgi:hypothetical protein